MGFAMGFKSPSQPGTRGSILLFVGFRPLSKRTTSTLRCGGITPFEAMYELRIESPKYSWEFHLNNPIARAYFVKRAPTKSNLTKSRHESICGNSPKGW